MCNQRNFTGFDGGTSWHPYSRIWGYFTRFETNAHSFFALWFKYFNRILWLLENFNFLSKEKNPQGKWDFIVEAQAFLKHTTLYTNIELFFIYIFIKEITQKLYSISGFSSRFGAWKGKNKDQSISHLVVLFVTSTIYFF